MVLLAYVGWRRKCQGHIEIETLYPKVSKCEMASVGVPSMKKVKNMPLLISLEKPLIGARLDQILSGYQVMALRGSCGMFGKWRSLEREKFHTRGGTYVISDDMEVGSVPLSGEDSRKSLIGAIAAWRYTKAIGKSCQSAKSQKVITGGNYFVFDVGKLYRIQRDPDERGLPFKAGSLDDVFATASGYDNYGLIEIPDRSILLFLGVKVLRLPISGKNESYVFLCENKLVMFKRDEVDKRSYFHRLR